MDSMILCKPSTIKKEEVRESYKKCLEEFKPKIDKEFYFILEPIK